MEAKVAENSLSCEKGIQEKKKRKKHPKFSSMERYSLSGRSNIARAYRKREKKIDERCTV